MNKILNKLKNIKPKQLVYPSIVGIVVALVAFVFVLSARFLAMNIDKSLVVDEQSATSGFVSIDLAGYAAVAKKIGINPNEPGAPPPASAPATVSPSLIDLSKTLAATSTKK